MTRFGLLGTGFWADTCHAAGLDAHPGVELVGIWGRDPEKARALARRYGVEAEPDLEALLGRVDAVAIAVPPDAQAELAVRAASAGCHLLLEKPIALSVDAAERVVAAAEDAGRASVVFFTQRFVEPVDVWLRESAEASRWDGATAAFLTSSLLPESPFSHSPWRREERGALWDLAPHLLAILIPALGPVAELVAAERSGETTQLVLRHEGGASSEVTVSATVSPADASLRLELWSAGGSTRAPFAADGVEVPYARAVSALLAAIDTGIPHECSAKLGLDVVRVLAAAERSLVASDVPA